MELDKDFTGTGWSFPPEFSKQEKTVITTSGIEDINNSLKIILSTRLGERVMNSAYGCDLHEFVFGAINLTQKTQIKEIVKDAIILYEPRIDLLYVDVDSGNETEGELLIQLDYQVRNTNTRSNIVFPFYKGEATEI